MILLLILIHILRISTCYCAIDDNSEYAELLKIDKTDKISPVCNNGLNGVMPHTSPNKYYRCDSGILTVTHCPEGEVFLPSTGRCAENENGSQRVQDTIISDPCWGRRDAVYPDYEQACRQFIRCQRSRLISKGHCPAGETFSFHLQYCLPEQRVSCVQPICHISRDGHFWQPGTFCRSYYECQKGTVVVSSCQNEKTFNIDTKICERSSPCYEPICTGRTDGDHADTSSGCKRFMKCKGGKLESIESCPLGQLHNGTDCQPEGQVICDPPENTAVAVDTVIDDCGGYSDGAHVIVGSSCSRYQICEGGKVLRRMKCPGHQIFNGLHCAPKNTTSCYDPCRGQPDGYHADSKEGCRKYHFCRGGETTERTSCPDGSLFSGQMCLPSVFVTCHPPKINTANPCIGLSNGFHPDYLNGCRDYYYCFNYLPVNHSSCEINHFWNGKNCERSHNTQCLALKKNEVCHGSKTGLYQDLSSGCSKYYYCNNGQAILLSCPEKEVFDGLNCRKGSEYKCPSLEHDTCYNKTDGYRVDQSSGCKSYYSCVNGQKISYVCHGTTVFNGKECVDNNLFSCPYVDRTCVAREEGYYPVLETECRKYYYCKDGSRLVTLSCDPGKAFDGTRCAPISNSNICAQKSFHEKDIR